MNHTNVKRALMVAIVVGSLLNCINSYDVFLNGNFTGRNILRIVLTYITPFCVSMYSSIKAAKAIQLQPSITATPGELTGVSDIPQHSAHNETDGIYKQTA